MTSWYGVVFYLLEEEGGGGESSRRRRFGISLGWKFVGIVDGTFAPKDRALGLPMRYRNRMAFTKWRSNGAANTLAAVQGCDWTE